MRKEWISYLHFQVRRAEQKSERKSIKNTFKHKNSASKHHYQFYWKLYADKIKHTTYLY